MNNPGHWQHWAQDTAVKNEQSRDTGKIGHKTQNEVEQNNNNKKQHRKLKRSATQAA